MRSKLVLLLFIIAPLAHAVPAPSPELINSGRTSFQTNCAVCHGEKGWGDGVAASGLNPKPRNLAKDPFKNGTAKEKVFETITKGLNGTAMPAFPQLNEQEKWSLVFYVLSLR